MSNFARSAALEKSRERILLNGILKQELLELEALRKIVAEANLEALRKKVAEAESPTAALKRSGHISRATGRRTDVRIGKPVKRKRCR
jgi:hypothetical protein